MLENLFEYHKNRKKFWSSVSIWIWRNACFMSDINAIFPNLNLIRISKRCAVEDVVQDQTVHSKMDNIYILPRSQRLYAILWFHIRYEQLVGVVNDAHNLWFLPVTFSTIP